MISFYLASGNNHKALEFSSLFDSNYIQILPAPSQISVEESGTTFLQNSFQKAEAYYNKFKKPVLADDSGLCVDALPNDLGVFSARFGGERLCDEERAYLLLDKLKGVETENRSAYFVCQLCFYLRPEEIYYFEGRLSGVISFEYRGENGFGYDPVFIPNKLLNDKTLAEDQTWKAHNSHRYKAVKKSEIFFKERNCQ